MLRPKLQTTVPRSEPQASGEVHEMSDPFSGRVAVITGGAGGIGFAMSEAFAARGKKGKSRSPISSKPRWMRARMCCEDDWRLTMDIDRHWRAGYPPEKLTERCLPDVSGKRPLLSPTR